MDCCEIFAESIWSYNQQMRRNIFPKILSLNFPLSSSRVKKCPLNAVPYQPYCVFCVRILPDVTMFAYTQFQLLGCLFDGTPWRS